MLCCRFIIWQSLVTGRFNRFSVSTKFHITRFIVVNRDVCDRSIPIYGSSNRFIIAIGYNVIPSSGTILAVRVLCSAFAQSYNVVVIVLHAIFWSLKKSLCHRVCSGQITQEKPCVNIIHLQSVFCWDLFSDLFIFIACDNRSSGLHSKFPITVVNMAWSFGNVVSFSMLTDFTFCIRSDEHIAI